MADRGLTELAIVLPVDCPLVAPDDLLRLADACADAAVPATGPLPVQILPPLLRKAPETALLAF